MATKFLKALLVASAVLVSTSAFAQEASVRVGGAPMYASKNIIENAVNSKDHTTLVAAVKAAGLVDALSGAGPFTVFAPVNAAFAALPEGTVDTLLKPENKGMLTKILTAHVVAGKYSDADLLAKAEANPGGFTLKTLSGDTLQFTKLGSVLYVVDESGDAAKITISDVNQSNGVIHVVNKVLLPK
ncbi:fasciclin domain-containing protein [uncultured Devosia sp.]|uniref:fasciclin domain-containing protein n=1 Tax=uncultured Devosia sp. TaxID=211434 RepID=UPI0035CBCC5C